MSADPVPDYAGLPLGRFLELVASREPAPGGGASAAVALALAAALAAMAARFSTERLPEAEGLAARADGLREEATLLARDDAAAYGRVLDAYRATREGEEARGRGIRPALTRAADVPLSVAEVGAEVAGISARLAVEGNPNLRGDAATAVVLAEAVVRAAALLVGINVSAGGTDDGRLSRASELRAAAAAARETAGAVEGVAARAGT